MNLGSYRFSRPNDLELVSTPKLSVAIVIACRNGQEKLNLTLASLALQTYPRRLTKVYVIDDGSKPAITLPKIRPTNTKVIRYKNSPGKWGKTIATNDCVEKLREDVLWFVDADMVFEPDHLAHHMKWHHDADDYAVLGWKRFVKNWDYSPAQLYALLKSDGFDDLHQDHWGKDLWEERIDRTNDLEKPGVEGFRAFVGATFSLKRSLWESVGGYNKSLPTGEDTELGWRLFLEGARIIPDRQAHSWHLGFSSVESNKNKIQRHNDPVLGQFVPGFAEIRKRSNRNWVVPTFEALIDCRGASLAQINAIKKDLERDKESQGYYRLLGPWMNLENRFSAIEDPLSDLREIRNWLLGDPRFTFEDISDDTQLSIEQILQNLELDSFLFFYFIEGDFNPALHASSLNETLLATGNGLVGIANEQDRRAFIVFAPALARASKLNGSIYKNISTTWGVRWYTNEEINRISSGRSNALKRFKNYIKREMRKVSDVQSFMRFVLKLIKKVLRKFFKLR